MISLDLSDLSDSLVLFVLVDVDVDVFFSLGDSVNPSFTFLEFLDSFFHENRLITSIGSLSLLANAILFTLYVNTERDETAKGIFIVTVFYGIGIIVIKLFN